MVTRTKLHICHGHLQHCNPNYVLQTSRAKFPKVQTALLLHVLGWDWIVVAVQDTVWTHRLKLVLTYLILSAAKQSETPPPHT